MATICLTRVVSPRLADCQLTRLERVPIDARLAASQHAAYERALVAMGGRVVRLPELRDEPDGVFVEDTAVVLDEVAVLTSMGAPARRAEVESVAGALAGYRPLTRIELPATLDGGDVLRIGRTLYVGRTTRTNDMAIRRLGEVLAPYGYRVLGVEVHGSLHLKSACTALGRGAILANRAWADLSPITGFEVVDVAPDEPEAANALSLGDAVLLPAAFPATAERLRGAGFEVVTVEIAELQKAECGVTCMSLLVAM